MSRYDDPRDPQDHRSRSTRIPPPPFSRAQRTTILYGILCFVLTLVIIQLWLLTATMHAFLGDDDSLIIPAGVASIICLLLNLGLLRYLYRVEKP